MKILKEKEMKKRAGSILFFLSLIIVLLSSTIVGCASAPFYPPVAFAVHQAGATAVTEVKADRDRVYELLLLFYCNKDKADMERVHKLVGSGRSRKDKTGKWVQINDGVPISVELKIVGLSEEVKGFSLEEKRSVDHLKGSTWCPDPIKKEGCGCFLKSIKGIRLKPGLYRITVKSLGNIPELEGTRLAIWFIIPANTKPFD